MSFNNKSLENYFKSARNHKSPITDEKVRKLIEKSDKIPSTNFTYNRKGIMTMTLSSLIIAGLIYFGLNTTSFENISNDNEKTEANSENNISNQPKENFDTADLSEKSLDDVKTTTASNAEEPKEHKKSDKIQGLNTITLSEDYLKVFGIKTDTMPFKGEVIHGIGYSTKVSETTAIYSIYTINNGSTHRFDKITANDTTKHIKLAPEALTSFTGSIYVYNSSIFGGNNELDEFFPFRSEFNDFINLEFHKSIKDVELPDNVKSNLKKLQNLFKDISFSKNLDEATKVESKELLTQLNQYFSQVKKEIEPKDTTTLTKHNLTFTFFSEDTNKDSLSPDQLDHYDDLGANVHFVNPLLRMVEYLKDSYSELATGLEKIQNNFQNYIFTNKMIAIEIPLRNNKSEGFILWYKPSQELIDILPPKYSKQLAKEFKLLEREDAICGANINVEETYLDIWRTCSGSIENLRVFPNPVEKELTVRFDLKESRNIQISIYDLEGNKIMDFKKAGYNSGVNTEFLDLTKLVPGIYIIAVQSENNEITMQRIIKK